MRHTWLTSRDCPRNSTTLAATNKDDRQVIGMFFHIRFHHRMVVRYACSESGPVNRGFGIDFALKSHAPSLGEDWPSTKQDCASKLWNQPIN